MASLNSAQATNVINLPRGEELKKLLEIDSLSDIEDLLFSSLTAPVEDLFSRPRKDIRAEIVRLGFEIASRASGQIPNQKTDQAPDQTLIDRCCEILETLHAGSLIVDDIQDGTAYRRGAQSLHLLYGIPIALNAGNWLYFLPFRLIDQLPLSEQIRARLTRECQKTLLLGHYGQALDVGVPVDALVQSRVSKVVQTSIELKSGALTGFALKLGALAMGTDESLIAKCDQFGRRLGASLQMFDDIGNVFGPDSEKRGEDLRLKRLTFVAAVTADTLPPPEFERFVLLLKAMPESFVEIKDLLNRYAVLEKATLGARASLTTLSNAIKSEIGLGELPRLDANERQLVSAYG